MSSDKVSNINEYNTMRVNLNNLIAEFALLQKGESDDGTLAELETQIKLMQNKMNRYKNNDSGIKKVSIENEIKMLELKLSNGIKNKWKQDTLKGLREAINIKKEELNEINNQEEVVYNAVDDEIAEIEESIDNLKSKINIFNNEIDNKRKQIQELRKTGKSTYSSKKNIHNHYNELDIFESESDSQELVWARQMEARSQYQQTYGKLP
jgi:chromosome segregation ATPase